MLFKKTSQFQVPEGKEFDRALAVGGGGGGCYGSNGGGGAGYVAASTIKVLPGSNYSVIVGEGGAGGIEKVHSGERGSASIFENLRGEGGFGGDGCSGGNGSSGGGGGNMKCSGGATADGGSVGWDGKTCSANRYCLGGKGIGPSMYVGLLSMFKKFIVSAGDGGAYGYGVPSGEETAGGGGGGVLINGKGVNGTDADRKLGFGPGGKGGIGYGAGGGAGGLSIPYGTGYNKGGNGAPGVVYIEWD